MSGRAVSPGGALLRSSRMFSIPAPLPEPQYENLVIGVHKSETMTKHSPQYQTITSPLSSREKGDWGFKRAFPLKTTMATSTPLIRVKAVDAVESVTDFASAADHSLSLEKFKEMRIAMSVPQGPQGPQTRQDPMGRSYLFHKSVFEEDGDATDLSSGVSADKRWKFKGPWLARMNEGEFMKYLNKQVRPRRAEFRAMLKQRLADDLTTRQNNQAQDQGNPLPPPIAAADITEERFTEYLGSLRHDRVTLYALVSKLLDLAPLRSPVGFAQTLTSNAAPESPYGTEGPPPSHPSAGISYLRTRSFMENHPVYGPQGRHTPVEARIVNPRLGARSVKLGVGGFVADAPGGENEFNQRTGRFSAKAAPGVQHLDLGTRGGAKAYVEPRTASVDPSGKVVLQLREANPEAKVIAKESVGKSTIYESRPVASEEEEAPSRQRPAQRDEWRMARVTEEIMSANKYEPKRTSKPVVGSSETYGLRD